MKLLIDYYPELAKWYSVNNPIPVESAQCGQISTRNYLWVCSKCGKEFKKNLASVVKSGNTLCSLCSRKESGSFVSISESDDPIVQLVLKRYVEGGNEDSPSDVSISSSDKKYRFICHELGEDKIHDFYSTISHMIRSLRNGNNGCSICSSKIVKAGINDFKSFYPNIAKYQDKSDSLDLSTVSYKSSLQATFICPDCVSVYTMALNNRVDSERKGKTGCPVCDGRIVVPGKNDFLTQFPDLAKMWDFEKNTLDPTTFTGRDEKRKCWFRCSNGHSFQSAPYSMIASRHNSTKGCPYCANQKILAGFNDFESQHPELMNMWDYSKNTVNPSEIGATEQSHKYWFLCEHGHSFQQSPYILITSKKKGNNSCPVCHNKIVQQGVNDLATTHPHLVDIFPYDINDEISPYNVTAYSFKEMNCYCKNPDCSNYFSTAVYNWVRGLVTFCPDCSNIEKSAECLDLANEIKSWGISVEEEVHLWNDARRVDILVKDRNIVIEYNGIYWHSEEIRDKNWHKQRSIDCKKLGYNVLFIWQDDWLYKRDIVVSLLKNKLGVSSSIKVNARDCIIKEVNSITASEFFNAYHLQGHVNSEAYIGLYKDSLLVALCAISDDNGNIYLKRYATSCTVRGGFSKLLSYIENTYIYESLYTFSDNDISDGSLYVNSGFIFDGSIKPDYKYVYKGRRVHKFNFRIERFRRDPSLLYEEGLSESQLADLNKLYRVWDSGKKKWSKPKPQKE